MLLYVTRTKQERLSRRITNTLQIYSAESSNELSDSDRQRFSSDNIDEDGYHSGDLGGGWGCPGYGKESAETSSKSGVLPSSAAFWLRSEYWSGDFSLGGGYGDRQEVVETPEGPVYDKLLYRDGRRVDRWSGDDGSDTDQGCW